MGGMNGKVIVITGSSSGIGAALAEVVAARGAKGVVLAARRAGCACRGREPASAPTRSPWSTDVTQRGVDRGSCAIAPSSASGRSMCGSATRGRGITRSVTELTDADLDDMMTTNVKSVLYGIQAVMPHFRERKAPGT